MVWRLDQLNGLRQKKPISVLIFCSGFIGNPLTIERRVIEKAITETFEAEETKAKVLQDALAAPEDDAKMKLTQGRISYRLLDFRKKFF